MRSENIKVTFKIPVPINKPDGNGVVYSLDAIKKACENANLQPIEIENAENEFIPIGVANTVEFIEGENCIKVDGIIRCGGTCEEVDMVNHIVEGMRITLFGISNK